MPTSADRLALAVQYRESGQLAGAEQLLREILASDPSQAEARCQLAGLYLGTGRFAEAAANFQQVLALWPNREDVYSDLGIALAQLGRTTEAVTSFRQALRLNPQHADALCNLGVVLGQQGQLADAVANYRQALRLRPDDPVTHNNLGNALRELGRVQEALAHYPQALRLKPDYAEAHNNQGIAYVNLGKLEEAAAGFRQALHHQPTYARAHSNLGNVLREMGRLAEALDSYQQALALDPDAADAHRGRALVWLLQGNFEQGWPEYEWRWLSQDLPRRPFSQPLWDGTPLAGQAILLHAEQGLGDTLQFIRYAPLVKERGGFVIVEAQEAVLPLLTACSGIDRRVARDSALPPFVTQAPLLSLAGIFRTNLATIPARVPYLFADDRLVEQWRRELAGFGPAFRIGIVWQGNPGFPADRQRSIPLAQFAALARLKGVRLFSLQVGPGTEQLAEIGPQLGVVDLGSRFDRKSLADAAAVLMNVDLLISSCTAVPHLAGALGVPVWLALPFAPDWRWLLEREDSPWYPRHRLFRQTEPGNWQPVFERMAHELAKLLAAQGPSPPASAEALTPLIIPKVHGEALKEAIRHHEKGDLDRAEALYRQILEADPSQAEAWYYLADCCLRRGRLDEAVAGYQRVVRLRPDHAAAHHDLGVAFANLGELEQAAASLGQAIRCRPDYAEAHANLGGVLTRQGKLLDALRCFKQALLIRPDYAEAYRNLGRVRGYLGQLPEAIACQQEALRINPYAAEAQQDLQEMVTAHNRLNQDMAHFRQNHPPIADDAVAYNELGLALQTQDRWVDALASFQEAVRLRPDLAEAYNNLGLTFKERGHGDEAILCLRQALSLKPDFVIALYNLGTLLERAGQFDQAAATYREALRHQPNLSKAYASLGSSLRELGQEEEAAACFQKALQLEPDSAAAHNNWGVLLDRQGKFDEALAHYNEAVRLDPQNPDIHINRAVVWILRGDFARGWPELEWRWKLKGLAAKSFPQPRWDGSALNGKTILLHAEFGLGDTLHFIRYAPLVKAHGGTVLVQCQRSVLPVLAGTPGIDRLLPQGAPLPPFDVHAPLLSLPGILGTKLDNVPADIPYLRVDDQRVERWQRELANRGAVFRIGIVWQGSRAHKFDRLRSVPLEQFAPLANLKGVRLFSLQVGSGSEQLAEVGHRLEVVDLGSRFDRSSLADSAAVLQTLDLLVTIDSALGHLAGGLGVPTWIALPFVPEWRWQLEREDSPWYPHHRLFRQTQPGNWQPVFERMGNEVRMLLEAPGSPASLRRPPDGSWGRGS